MEKIISKIEEQNLRLKSIEELLHLSKKVLNIDEVCKLTGLSKSSIYRCTHKGTIPFYKQAKHLFFDKLEIESWLKENRGYYVKDDSNY